LVTFAGQKEREVEIVAGDRGPMTVLRERTSVQGRSIRTRYLGKPIPPSPEPFSAERVPDT
jgi:hypothetical protein